MLYSKPYDYYRDADDQNLGHKLRYAAKCGVEIGTYMGGLDIMCYNRPKNFAHLFSIFGKWIGVAVLGMCLHSATTYTLAKQTGNKHALTNHFFGGLGPGVLAFMMFNKPYYIFTVTVLLGGWASHQKSKMISNNTTQVFDPVFIRGTGGLYQGQFSPETFFRRNIFTREDKGRRTD